MSAIKEPHAGFLYAADAGREKMSYKGKLYTISYWRTSLASARSLAKDVKTRGVSVIVRKIPLHRGHALTGRERKAPWTIWVYGVYTRREK